MCGWKSNKINKALGLKTQIRRAKHDWHKKRAQTTARKDVRNDKLEVQQEDTPTKVYWGREKVQDSWRFIYLGSLFQADGDQTPDIKRRIAMAKSRAGALRHVWSAALPLTLKLRLYVSACCSILTYGSEAWVLLDAKAISGANAYMLSHITGRTKHEEASTATTFSIIPWIRARRLKWVGHILRLPDTRLISQTLQHIYDNPQNGDLLMDIPPKPRDGYSHLQKIADDREKWRDNVRKLKAIARKGIPTTPRRKKKQDKALRKSPTKSIFHFHTAPLATTNDNDEATASTKNAITTTTTNPFSIAAEVARAKALRAVGSSNMTYSFIPASKKKSKPIKKPKKISNTK